MKFEIKDFKPNEAELRKKAMAYSKLEIKDLDDKKGFQAVEKARKELMKTRTSIKAIGKEARQEARDYAAGIIQLENDLIDIINPTEKELMLKKLRVENAPHLEARMERFAELGITMEEDDALVLKETEYKKLVDAKLLDIAKEEEHKAQIEKEVEQRMKTEADDKAEAEAHAKAEQAKALASDKAFKKWLSTTEYKKGDKVVKDASGMVTVYRVIASKQF